MTRSKVDVVVVGGGIVGAASAYHLVKTGMSVALVERDRLAWGASGRNPGFVWLHTRRVGPAMDLARRSRASYETLQDELDYDFEFRGNGGMIFFYTEDQAQVMKEFVEARVADGLDMQLVDATGARELAPALAEGVLGATFCTEDAQIRTAKLVRAFAVAAQRLGAEVHEGAEVVDLSEPGVVRTTAGDFATSTTVVAAGVWTRLLSERLGHPLPIRPMRLQVVATEPLPMSLERPVYGPRAAAQYDLFHNLPSYRPEYFGVAGDGGDLPFLELACQTKRGRFLLGCPMDFVGFESRPDIEGVTTTCSELPKHLPVLEGAAFERAWAGLLPHTPDSLPIIDRFPERDDLVIASGHVFGNAAGPATGEMVAALVSGGAPPLDLSPYAVGRSGLTSDGTAW